MTKSKTAAPVSVALICLAAIGNCGRHRVVSAFAPINPSFAHQLCTRGGNAISSPTHLAMKINDDGDDKRPNFVSAALALAAATSLAFSSSFAGPVLADTPASASQKYDGFAEYAKENKMEQSDVGCFINKCGDQTKQLFSNPRGIKGVSCLGRCKGEQSCATRCFAEFGSEDLDNWLSCTIEENECVKVPKNVDNSAENVGYSTAIKKFDPSSLIGKWYKVSYKCPRQYLRPFSFY